MSITLRFAHGVRLPPPSARILFLAACASKNTTAGAPASGAGAGGAAVPGSQQDFVVNVGDRVFFQEDQSDLTGAGAGDAWPSRRSGCRPIRATR